MRLPGKFLCVAAALIIVLVFSPASYCASVNWPAMSGTWTPSGGERVTYNDDGSILDSQGIAYDYTDKMAMRISRSGSSCYITFGEGTLNFIDSERNGHLIMTGLPYESFSGEYADYGRSLNGEFYLGSIGALNIVSIEYVDRLSIDFVVEDTSQRYVKKFYGEPDGAFRRITRVRFRKTGR